MKQTGSIQYKAKPGQIQYNPETFSYSVSDSEQRRLQGKYPYDDIQAAIIQAGKHTQRYSENARQSIKADPCQALEFDLECWLFSPKPQQQAQTLAELAQQIRLSSTFVREALTGQIDAKLAGRDLVKFYPMYYELGGTGFQPTYNAAIDLVNLLESCGAEKRLPRLQEIDVKILKHLNTAELAKKLSDLEAELDVPRETVGKSLQVLRMIGLTHPAQGQKGAEAISAQGRDFLKTL
jgi:hypothetical protein